MFSYRNIICLVCDYFQIKNAFYSYLKDQNMWNVVHFIYRPNKSKLFKLISLFIFKVFSQYILFSQL